MTTTNAGRNHELDAILNRVYGRFGSSVQEESKPVSPTNQQDNAASQIQDKSLAAIVNRVYRPFIENNEIEPAPEPVEQDQAIPNELSVEAFRERADKSLEATQPSAIFEAGLNFKRATESSAGQLFGNIAGVVSPQFAAQFQDNLRQEVGDFDPGTISGFLGTVSGQIIPAVAAVITTKQAAPFILGAGFAASSAGGKRVDILRRREAGEEISGIKEWTVALAFGAAEAIGEIVGASALQKAGKAIAPLAKKLVTEASQEGSKATLKTIAKNLLEASGVNATEEMITQVAQNTIEKLVLNPDQSILEGTATAAGQGAVGGLIGAGAIGAATSASQTGQASNATADTEPRQPTLPPQPGELAGDNTQNQVGEVRDQEPVRQEPVEAGIQESGVQEAQAGGVLQAQEEVTQPDQIAPETPSGKVSENLSENEKLQIGGSALPTGVKDRGTGFAAELMEASRRMKATARRKRMRGNVLGQFKRTLEQDTIEVGDIRNQTTVAHELGHSIDFTIHGKDVLGSLSKRIGSTSGEKTFRDELKAVSYLFRGDPAGSSKSHIRYRHSAKELMADYVAMLSVDPDQARSLAPTFTEAFEAKLAEVPEVQSVIQELQAGSVEPVGPDRQTATQRPIKTPGQQPPDRPGFKLPSSKVTEPSARAAVESLVTEAVRTRKARTFRSFQKANKWQKDLSERQLQDIGAFVEGIGNLEIQGDTAQEVSKRLTEKQKEVVKEYRFEQELARQEVNRYLEGIGEKEYISYLEDYLAHFYASPSKQIKQTSGRLIKNSPNSKKRKLPTLKEAIDAGLVPVTQDVATLHKMWAELNWRVATNRKFLKALRDINTEDGQRVIQPISQAPSDWVTINHPSIAQTFARKTPSGETLLWQGGAKVHPDVAIPVLIMLNDIFRGKWINRVELVNSVAKTSQLSFSFFHHAALTESANAVLARWWNPIRGVVMVGELDPVTGQRKIFQRPNRAGRRIAELNPDFAEYAISKGLTLQSSSDVNINRVNRSIRDIEAKARNIPVLNQIVKRARQFKEGFDRNLWEYYHSGLKLHSFHDLLSEEIRLHPEWDQTQIDTAAETISNFINDAYGGQEWETKFWLNPKVRQAAHWSMLAPDWTLSNINIGGKTITEIKNPLRRKQQLRYWRNMIPTLIGSTWAIQAMIFSMFGDEEQDDKPFSFENEIDRQFDIDVTPITRKFPWSDPDDKSRRYVTFGKQAKELMRWATEPMDLLRRKSSPIVQIGYEQLVGSQGGGFDSPFLDTVGVENVVERSKAIAIKFVPFSWRGNNFAFTAPLRKGMSKYRGRKSYEKVLHAYADPSIFPVINKHKNYETSLSDMGSEISGALKLNGLDPKPIFNQALSKARSVYYTQFFKAMESQDEDGLLNAAESIIRLHAGVSNILLSARNRQIKLTPEDQDLMNKYIVAADKSVKKQN